MNRVRIRLIASHTILVLFSVAGGLAAQTAAFTDVQRVLSVGESLIVTRTDGTEITGRVSSVDQSLLVLQGADNQLIRVPPSDASIIKRKDRLANGARNGFWVGLAASAVPIYGVAHICRGEENGVTECLPAMLGISFGFGVIGAGIGALVDALRLEVLYRAPVLQGLTTSVQPIVRIGHRRRAVGLQYSIRP